MIAKPIMKTCSEERWFWLARSGVILICVMLLGIVVAFTPVRYAQVSNLCHRDEAVLLRFGLSVPLCAGYLLTFNLLPLFAYSTWAGVFLWCKPHDRFSLLTCLHIVSFAVICSSFNALAAVSARWVPVTFVRAIGTAV